MRTEPARRATSDNKQAFEDAIRQLSEAEAKRVVSHTPIYRRTGDSRDRALKDAARALASLWRPSS